MHIKSHVLLLLLMAFSCAGNAQSDETSKAEGWQKLAVEGSYPGFVLIKPDLNISAASFFSEYGSEFGIGGDHKMVFLKKLKGKSEFERDLYQRYYKGIPIYQTITKLKSRNGKLLAVLGLEELEIQSSAIASLNAEEALERAMAHINAAQYVWEISKPADEAMRQKPRGELMFTMVPKNGEPDQWSYELAYRLEIETVLPRYSAREIFIHALTGEVLMENDLVAHTNVPGTVETMYHGTQSNMTVYLNGTSGLYELMDGDRDIETLIYTNSPNGSIVTDSDTHFEGPPPPIPPNPPFPPTNKQIAASAHWAAQRTYDFYLNEFGYEGLDGVGGLPLRILCNDDDNPDNASYTEIGSIGLMRLGEGGSLPSHRSDNPFVSMEIVAHEFSHAVIVGIGGPPPNGQGGTSNETPALNESFCDMFGHLIEYEVLGSSDYFPLDEVWKGNLAGHARNMAEPNLKLHPHTWLGNHWHSIDANGDTPGAHSRAGVPNFWFYLLMEGGSGTSDGSPGYDYCVLGIGREKMKGLLYETFTDLSPTGMNSAGFIATRDRSIAMAELEFGANSFEASQVAEAWNAVGVTGGMFPFYDTDNPPSTVFDVTDLTNGTLCTDASIVAAPAEQYPSMIHNWYVYPQGGNQGSAVASCFDSPSCTLSISTPGNYVVEHELTHETACITYVETKDITVYPTPQASVSDAGFCSTNIAADLQYTPLVGGTMTGPGVFSNSSSGWDMDATVAGVGQHTVEYEFIQNGCTATVNATIEIHDPLAVALTVPAADVCQGDPFAFNAVFTNSYPGNAGYDWTFSNGSIPSSSAQSPSVSFNANPGEVEFEATNNCGTFTQAIPIAVSLNYSQFAISTNDICGNTAIQTNYTGPSNVIWSGAGVNPNTGFVANPTADVTSIAVTATIDNACGETDMTNVTVYKQKDITPTTFCKYDMGTTTLAADLDLSPWVAVPNSTYPDVLPMGALNSSGGFTPSAFTNPTVPGGQFRVQHQSVCNTFGIIQVFDGGPLGSEDWPKKVNGAGGFGNDAGKDIARDDNGGYFFAGTYTGTIQFENANTSTTHNSVGSSQDIFVAKYDDCGFVWSFSYGTNGVDEHVAIVYDETADAVFLSGTIDGAVTMPGGCATCVVSPNSSEKGFIAKIDAVTGKAMWATIPDNSIYRNQLLDIDAVNGHVAATGNYQDQFTLGSTFQTVGTGTDRDIITVSLTDLGSTFTFLGANSYGGSQMDIGNGVAIMPSTQDVYITGSVRAHDLQTVNGVTPYVPLNAGGKEFFVGKYSPQMAMSLALVYGGLDDDEGLSIDAENSVFVSGYVEGTIDMMGTVITTNTSSRDAFVAAIHPTGYQIWNALGGSNGGLDQASSIHVEGLMLNVAGEFSGNASFAGFSTGLQSASLSDREIYIATHSATDGSGAFISSVQGSGSDDYVHGLVADSDAKAYFTGSYTASIMLNDPLTSIGGADFFAARYDNVLNTFFKTDFDEEASAMIMAYPNPTRGLITLQTMKDIDQVEIFNVNGQQVRSLRNLQAGTMDIDLTPFASGLFLIRASSGNYIEQIRIVKQ